MDFIGVACAFCHRVIGEEERSVLGRIVDDQKQAMCHRCWCGCGPCSSKLDGSR